MEVRSKRIGPRLSPKKAQLRINEREISSNQAFWPEAKGFGPKRTCPKTDHPLVHQEDPPEEGLNQEPGPRRRATSEA